ncbi:hypothetical protein N8D55_00775 [Xanthomonas hortorum pv. pelargonii]|nr:hypothetical protein N8D55_00775 [Xanthomonas hortorum pv. pelargonii]
MSWQSLVRIIRHAFARSTPAALRTDCKHGLMRRLPRRLAPLSVDHLCDAGIYATAARYMRSSPAPTITHRFLSDDSALQLSIRIASAPMLIKT